MKHSLARRTRWLALLGLALSVARCNSGGDSSDGKSSWLEDCRRNADCTGETSCHCGVCTKGCEKASDCAGLSSSTCVEAAESSATDCRVGVFAQSGVCLPSCSDDGECPGRSGTMHCESGICIPKSVVVGSDGGVIAPPPEGGTGGASNTGSASGIGGVSTGGTATTGGTPGAGGSTAGGLIGEANAYGGPVEISNDFPSTCQNGSVYQDTTSSCLGFGQCKQTCQHDNECPGVAGGSAVPVCGWDLYCQLLCEEGRICPTGMACMRIRTGTFCMWQNRVPDCTAFDPCSSRPTPSFCPADGCAAEAVACSDALGVACCAGLRCGPENFCVKEGS